MAYFMRKEGDAGTSRGNVRRLSTNTPSSKTKVEKMGEEQALTKWSRRQDYHSS